MTKGEKAGLAFALCIAQAANAKDHNDGKHLAHDWTCLICLLRLLFLS